MEIFALLLWIFIGLLFGLMGAGGSILTLPILVYLFRIDVSTATLYSLFIVGTTSLLGAFSYMRQGLFDRKAALDFGLPSIVAVVVTKMCIDPIIPAVFFTFGGKEFTKATFLMCLLSVIMLTSSYRIIRDRYSRVRKEEPDVVAHHSQKLTMNGILVGVLSGLIGIGGGFLIIPALILFCKLPIKQAVGTSLTIIAVQSLAGFLSGYRAQPVNWSLILPITSVAILGVILGTALSKQVDAERLKIGLGWFIGITAFFIIAQETILKTV